MSNNNSIVEAIVDIFFETNTLTEVFLSTILNLNGFDKITKLPISQIPEAIRKNNPNLQFEPLYEISSNAKDYKIVLGDVTIGIAINGKYKGWDDSFFPQIQEVFQKIFDTQQIIEINRIGMRYINFFPNENIFETGKVKVAINNNEATDKKMFLKINDCIDGICYNKTITNDNNYLNRENKGSIIDIVTFLENVFISIDNSIFDTINQLHTLSKDKFKEVISDEYITKFNL